MKLRVFRTNCDATREDDAVRLITKVADALDAKSYRSEDVEAESYEEAVERCGLYVGDCLLDLESRAGVIVDFPVGDRYSFVEVPSNRAAVS